MRPHHWGSGVPGRAEECAGNLPHVLCHSWLAVPLLPYLPRLPQEPSFSRCRFIIFNIDKQILHNKSLPPHTNSVILAKLASG